MNSIPGPANMPIYVKPVVSYRPGGGRVHIMAGPKAIGDLPITDVVIFLPLPKQLVNASLTTNYGTIRIDQITKMCRWDVGRLPKEAKTPILEGTLTLPTDFIPDSQPTVRAEFQVKSFVTSGIKVDGLAIRGVKYKPFKGVRTVTQGGKFQMRCASA